MTNGKQTEGKRKRKRNIRKRRQTRRKRTERIGDEVCSRVRTTTTSFRLQTRNCSLFYNYFWERSAIVLCLSHWNLIIFPPPVKRIYIYIEEICCNWSLLIKLLTKVFKFGLKICIIDVKDHFSKCTFSTQNIVFVSKFYKIKESD